jgi:hypothetical protein
MDLAAGAPVTEDAGWRGRMGRGRTGVGARAVASVRRVWGARRRGVGPRGPAHGPGAGQRVPDGEASDRGVSDGGRRTERPTGQAHARVGVGRALEIKKQRSSPVSYSERIKF